MKRQHKHAALIQQWLDDDSLIVERKAGDGNWYKQTDCFWNEESEYRFKPKMIRCGDLEFPEPMRVAPELDTRFWLATTLEDVLVYRWENDAFDQKVLSRGICHLTEEAAEAHARALIALTEVK